MGSNKGKAGAWHAHNAVMEAVNGLGWRVALADRETVIASDGVVRLRARLGANVLEFGVEADFDRWANSTDMVFDVTDYEASEVEEALRVATWLAGKGMRREAGDDWVDLRDHLARYRASRPVAA